MDHTTHDFAKTLGAFLPLRVGGVCGADGERAGVRCAFHHFGFHAAGGLPPCPRPSFGIMKTILAILLATLSAFALRAGTDEPPVKLAIISESPDAAPVADLNPVNGFGCPVSSY